MLGWRSCRRSGQKRGGIAQALWNSWNTADTVKKTPPLKFLKGADFRFTAGEGMRAPRQKLNDMKTLCKYVEGLAASKGLETANLTIEEADKIFLAVATEENRLICPPGMRQHRWATTLKKVRESKKTHKKQDKQIQQSHQ